MARLIDADELVKFLKGCTMSNGTLINTNTMLAVIYKMPTAYDVEKVVGELEEEKTMAYDKFDGGSSYKAYSQAIEIVRKGGVE